MYGPSICAAFQQRRGDDIEVSLFTSGCPFDDVPTSPYKMWHIPLLLKSKPGPSFRFVPATHPLIKYTGVWFPWITNASDKSEEHPQATQSQGASAELAFNGTGIDYVGQKTIGLGEVEIFLDGQSRSTRSLLVNDFPALFGVTLYSEQGLARGEHVLKIVCRSDARINLEGFRIYS